MGFSVSGSVAIIFIGVLIAFGVMFPAIMESSQQLGDARSAQNDRLLEQQNTEVIIQNATYDSGADELTVNVTNNGTVSLDINETDFLVDGEYRTVDGGDSSIDGDTTTEVWLPGEKLVVTITSVTSTPSRVKVVTENGVSDSTEAIQ